MRHGVSAVVLAAGRSKRAGSVNKLLLPWNGRPLLGHVLAALRASQTSEIVVVTGYQAGRIAPLARAALAGSGKKRRIVHAAGFPLGLSASLKAGIGAVSPGAHGVLVCLGDMPLLTPETIDSLLSNFTRRDAAALPLFGKRRGNPVILSRRLFPQVMRLTGDKGARSILKRCRGPVRLVPVADRAVLLDIDRREDWMALRKDSAPQSS
jgi:molybdenum cofactor cytidylyltransferase